MRLGQLVRANGARGIIAQVGDELNDYQVFFPETGTTHYVPACELQDISIDLAYVRGGKIQAVKSLRELIGLGLHEAKDLVEAIADACNNGSRQREENLNHRIAVLMADVIVYQGRIAAFHTAEAERNETIGMLHTDNMRLRNRVNNLLDVLTPDQLREIIVDNL